MPPNLHSLDSEVSPDWLFVLHLCFRALGHCEDMIQRYSREVNRGLCSSGTALPYCSNSNVGKAVEDCMRAIIGVLLNLTHDNGQCGTSTCALCQMFWNLRLYVDFYNRKLLNETIEWGLFCGSELIDVLLTCMAAKPFSVMLKLELWAWCVLPHRSGLVHNRLRKSLLN